MIGKILGNRYEIVEKIGGGGMSYVYKAKCKVLNRYVAIKVLRQELTSDPEFVEKFKQESLSAASLAHPNIVNIYDTGIENDIYYIVMEYVKGETLKKYIQKKGRLSEDETIVITRQIAEALKHAHANKIVHRDIKPHNILLTEDGIVKVTDFGIARAASSSTINNTSNVIGSVHYFSPEQARGGYVDEKSDIYSLGIVMYEMITGVVPFDADNHISVAMKQIQEKAVPPSKRINNLNISKELEDIIMKCLEKHQSFRFQNIDEILNKLNKFNGFTRDNLTIKEELIDSPTIVMPKINSDNNKDEEKNIIELNIIDESDKAFKTFFGEDNDNNNMKKGLRNNKKVKDEDDENGESRKKNLKITILAILSALIVAVIGGIIGFKALLYVPEVTVPDIVGKSEAEAQKVIEDLGLVFKVSGREFNNEFDAGEVVWQSVDEGMKLKKDFPIEVVISKGTQEIKVPNLIGKYAIEVGIILSEEGLKEGKASEEYNDNIPPGQIIDQNPKAGTPAEKDDKVDYKVSLGPKTIYAKMPKLVGLNVEIAKYAIQQNGLTVGQITEENSDTIPTGEVMRQSVPEGQEVAQGTAIWMTVSKGPAAPEEPTEPGDGTGNDEQPGNTAKSYPLTITLPKNKEKVSVIVQRVTQGGRELIYSKEVNTSEQSIIINIEGKGTQEFEIYIENELYDKVEVKFE